MEYWDIYDRDKKQIFLCEKEDYLNTDVYRLDEIEGVRNTENFFEKYPIVELKEEKLKLFLNGVQLTNNNDDGLYQIKVNNVVVGIGTIKNKLLKREIIY